VNGAFFSTTDHQSTGTGLLSPFLQVQRNSGEEGFNHSNGSGSGMDDEKQIGSHTTDILLGNVRVVTNPAGAAPGSYYEFLLDVNQTGANPLLSIDNLRFYTKSGAFSAASIDSATTSGNDSLAFLDANATLRYNLDSSDIGNEVLLNYSLNSGSGSGDAFIYIPTSSFAGALSTDQLYLYATMGHKSGYQSNDGFEEFATRAPLLAPDAGTSVALLGVSMLSLSLVRKKGMRSELLNA
jgi:hypothetical protein